MFCNIFIAWYVAFMVLFFVALPAWIDARACRTRFRLEKVTWKVEREMLWYKIYRLRKEVKQLDRDTYRS